MTASNPSTTLETVQGAAPLQRRDLWQVPMFCLGLAAFVLVAAVRPFWQDPDQRRVERLVHQIRHQLIRQDASAEQVVQLGEELQTLEDRFPQRRGEIHYLIGSAWIKRGLGTSYKDNPEPWRKARLHLEQAEALGLPEADHAQFLFRLARVLHEVGANPNRVIEILSRSVEHLGEQRGEGYALLTEAYLRLPNPDLQAALIVNQKQLSLPTDQEDVLAPARLLRGELLLRLQQRAEARKVLARIRSTAAPDILIRSRLLMAQSYQEDGLYAEAVKLWEEVRADRATNQPRVLYALGICYRKLERPAEAAAIWDRLIADAGPEGQAAALQLASLRLEQGQGESALELFGRALRNVNGPSDYNNPLLPLSEAWTLVEAGCNRFREAGDPERGRALAELYARLAPPGTAQSILAQMSEAAARIHQQQAERPELPSHERERHRLEARRRFREAAQAFIAAADSVAGKPTETDWLRHSAGCYLNGNDQDGAIAVLERFVKLQAPAEQLGEAWYRLAEAHQVLNHEVAADLAYKKCIEYPGPFAFAARYHLAMRQMATRHYEDAEDILKQNLELMRLNPDPAIYEKTIYALGDVLHRRQNHRLAVLRLEEALQRFPENPKSAQARYQLGQSYRLLAGQEQEILANNQLAQEVQQHHRREFRNHLQKAKDVHLKLLDDLLAKEKKVGVLAVEETQILRDAWFAVADSWLELGRYPEAGEVYEQITKRYPGQIDELIACREQFRCAVMQANAIKARGALERIKHLLTELNDAAFRARPDIPPRLDWEKWYSQALERFRSL